MKAPRTGLRIRLRPLPALLGASLWIASADDPRAASEKAVQGFLVLVAGLRRDTSPAQP